METTTFNFEMPDTNLARFKALMVKVSRKSEKLGFAAIRYGTYRFRIDKERGKIWEMYINAPSLKVGGWQFVAVIDHTHETGNVIRSLPNQSIPEKFRSAKPVCEHCGINRYRRDTFVLRADNGDDFKQVGKTCLTDFLGHDPAKLAQLAEQIGKMHDDIRGFEGGGVAIPTIHLDLYLGICAAAIREHGWKSRKLAFETGARATADVALDMYYSGLYDVTAADKKVVAGAMAWAESLDEKSEKSDYEHNVTIVAGSELIEPRSAGIAASIVGVYLMKEQRAGQETQSTQVSNFVGEIGKRFSGLPVKVVLVRPLETSTLCKFQDKDGNVLTWFSTSGSKGLVVGDKLTLTGTVKKHDVYQGVKSTLINRCELEISK